MAEDTDLDKRLSELGDAFSQGVSALSTNYNIRTGLMRAALNEAVWSLYHDFEDCRFEMADQIYSLADAVKDQCLKDAAAKSSPE